MSFDANSYDHDARIHATLSSVGFIVLLPVGMLIARYARAFTPRWFWPHAVWQFLIAGPVIIAGFAYAVIIAKQVPALGQFNDPHKKAGLALFIMYLCQLFLGIVSHSTRGPRLFFFLHRSPQRVLHILLGLAIFGLSFWQVRYGYTVQWVTYVGTPVPPSVHKAWLALVIIFPVLYVLGYAFLPKQLSQEAASRNKVTNGNGDSMKELNQA
ncbi:hypothetical protein M422DRAFT_47617 [Sphaerobolus stellatus SS14]|uniref:Cytochrome b561 domain-containing protein n=1 Tax=Sphaerobolus stellatus (strain SS14) TaxID=990650 RepID=A0A0C9VZW5_SPHS4|nr:hypothetical protein M422DRAFT_47617 [Sphaerobolus stellatus SS14]